MPPFDSSESSLPTWSSLPQWIGERANRHGERIAVTFVGDDRSEQSWTYAELWQRSCEVARGLPATATGQPRALLLYPPGIEFVAGFLGCQIAGWVPVPTCYPRGGREMRRLDSVATDCRPSAILGDEASLDNLQSDRLCEAARGIPKIVTGSKSAGRFRALRSRAAEHRYERFGAAAVHQRQHQ